MKEEFILDAVRNADFREQGPRKPYGRLSLSPLEIFTEELILNGSETDIVMAPNKVEVEEYAFGFDDVNGKDIGFDLTF